ncbi:ATP synthase subunit delta, mitochondrial [Cloeon dipterum]|uniref:ATP synthase subunit delta, mitochondrial n=1 Tax=Cloeon dipterum TaxID=197152 RepID=UPI0032209913
MAVIGRSVRSALRLLASRPLTKNAISRGYAEGNEMAFTFAAPNQVFYNAANVRQVDVPSFSGSFGILPKHVPTLAVLKPGVVTVLEADGSPKRFFVSSGSVTINEDSSVQVLAEEAVPVEHLDASAARDALSKAQSALSSASGEAAKAEAQIAIEVAEAVVKACE